VDCNRAAGAGNPTSAVSFAPSQSPKVCIRLGDAVIELHPAIVVDVFALLHQGQQVAVRMFALGQILQLGFTGRSDSVAAASRRLALSLAARLAARSSENLCEPAHDPVKHRPRLVNLLLLLLADNANFLDLAQESKQIGYGGAIRADGGGQPFAGGELKGAFLELAKTPMRPFELLNDFFRRRPAERPKFPAVSARRRLSSRKDSCKVCKSFFSCDSCALI